MDITILGVPIYYGSDRKGVELGPYILRKKHLIDELSKNDLNLYDLGNLTIPMVSHDGISFVNTKMKYLKEILEVDRNLAQEVYASLCAKSFPFVIGGDHSLGLGSISGASKYYDDLGVIWIDAHGDINTENTTLSGNIHGMPLASAMGFGNKELTNLYYPGKKVDSKNVYIIGARDLDPGEIDLIRNKSLNVFTTKSIREIGISSLVSIILNQFKKNNIKALHLSFDIDCIDSSLVPGTGTRVENGLKLQEAKLLVNSFMSSGLVKSMDFVELNPLLDKEGVTSNIAIDIIKDAFSYLN